jgi:glycosyltransferase involved in cell wall biosynthesis
MSQPLFPIMVKVWAGLQRHDLRYIRRSLPSLLQSDLPLEARVVFINDCSLSPRIEPYLDQLRQRHANVEVWRNPERMGPNRGQAYNFPRLVERFPDARHYVICDDDIIYHPGWLQRLMRVQAEASAMGLRGIFAALNLPAKETLRTVQLPTCSVILKRRHPALNWLLPRDVYEAIGPFRDVGIAYDSDYWNRAEPLGIPAICLQPSWVQNIGYHGAYQSDDSMTARDYVGRLDWWLRGRDLWWAIQRHTVGRGRAWLDRPPETRLKFATRRFARGLRRLVGLGN